MQEVACEYYSSLIDAVCDRNSSGHTVSILQATVTFFNRNISCCIAIYVGLGGLLLTGAYTAYVAFEEGYVKDIFEGLVGDLPDLAGDVFGGIFGGIGKLF